MHISQFYIVIKTPKHVCKKGGVTTFSVLVSSSSGHSTELNGNGYRQVCSRSVSDLSPSAFCL